MIRHAKPLRADRKIAEHTSVRAVARGLSAVVNAGLRLRDKRPKTRRRLDDRRQRRALGEKSSRRQRGSGVRAPASACFAPRIT